MIQFIVATRCLSSIESLKYTKTSFSGICTSRNNGCCSSAKHVVPQRWLQVWRLQRHTPVHELILRTPPPPPAECSQFMKRSVHSKRRSKRRVTPEYCSCFPREEERDMDSLSMPRRRIVTSQVDTGKAFIWRSFKHVPLNIRDFVVSYASTRITRFALRGHAYVNAHFLGLSGYHGAYFREDFLESAFWNGVICNFQR